MKVSDLITRLQIILQEQGNLEIITDPLNINVGSKAITANNNKRYYLISSSHNLNNYQEIIQQLKEENLEQKETPQK